MASKPVIFSLDDEPEVLRAVEMDLRRQYGQNYRIMRAENGATALDTVQKLMLRNEAVALFLVDQRMPQMTGVEFLEQAMQIYPTAKRVLLTAYADTDAAIRAINAVKIDYYLMKPWDPPEENLYPVLSDLLEEWQAGYRPPYEGIRVIGNRWAPKTHYLREFLARNQIPYKWLDVERSDDAQQLLQFSGEGHPPLPVMVFSDGVVLSDPTMAAVAEKLGLKTQPTNPSYDLAIVGGGPAGLAAAVYGGSEGLKTVLIERSAPGGQAGLSSRIENYLGFPQGLSGMDLTRRAVIQAKKFGVEILAPQEVIGLTVQDRYKILHLSDGTQVACQALFIATGVSWRTLEVPGIDKLNGAGVYYGASMTEGQLLQDEDVYIIGGANSAGQGAMYFSRFARSVNMLIRGTSIEAGMSQYLVDQIAATPNIHVMTCCQVVEVQGEERLESITIENSATGERTTIPTNSLFIFIGAQPGTDWLQDVVERDSKGFILSGPDLTRGGTRPKGWKLERDPFLLETSVPGIFVAGDVRHESVKRVASAVGEGSVGVRFVHQYLGEL
jgi:thioredoxin reductase (NADPH)